MSGSQDLADAPEGWRALLRASSAVISDLSLETVLHRIVAAACELVQAPYGALGVVRPDGSGLERFIHVGMDQETVDRLGHLPEGKGLLGALIEDPRPIRLRDLTQDPRSVGFPQFHPPMRGFIGVPIRVRDEVFGNLYLASDAESVFTEADEELVSALAATAGFAIGNARLYEESRLWQEWLAASTEITRRVLTAPGEDALRLVAQRVAELAAADVVTVALPDDVTDVLRVTVAVGLEADRLVDHSYPVPAAVARQVLDEGVPRVFEDASRAEGGTSAAEMVDGVLPLGPAVVLPVPGARGSRGILLVGRRRGNSAFTAAEVDMITDFAHHASVALELAEGRREAQRAMLLEDRARIARDLHDHVIQQLFAAGMRLQGVLPDIGVPESRDAAQTVVAELDDAIRQIRASIFQLRPASRWGSGLRSAVLALVGEVAPALGHEPRVRFSGPVDLACDEELLEDVLAVVREGLTNIARHAHARRTDVSVTVRGSRLSVVIADDGSGPGERARRSGLANLAARAERRAGALELDGSDEGGTRLAWRVPLGDAHG